MRDLHNLAFSSTFVTVVAIDSISGPWYIVAELTTYADAGYPAASS